MRTIVLILTVACLTHALGIDYDTFRNFGANQYPGFKTFKQNTKRTSILDPSNVCPPNGSDWTVYNELAKYRIFTLFLNHVALEGTCDSLVGDTLTVNNIHYILPVWHGGYGRQEMVTYYQNLSCHGIPDSNDGRWNVSINRLAIESNQFDCTTNKVNGTLTIELVVRANLTYVAGSPNNNLNPLLPGMVLKGTPGDGGKVIKNPLVDIFYTVVVSFVDSLLDVEIVNWNVKDILRQLNLKNGDERCWYNQYIVEPGYLFDDVLPRFLDKTITTKPFRSFNIPTFDPEQCD